MSTIFWDFDGTLVYSEHLWSGSMYRAITSVAPEAAITFKQIRECNTRGYTWQTPERDHSAYKGDAWWIHFEAHAYTSYLSCGIDESVAAAAAALVHSFILQPENYYLFPDTIDTLVSLKQRGHRHILVSNNFPDLQNILIATNLLPYFDGVIISAVEGYDKPRKELFDIAVKRYPDTSYYMIGDNPKADVLGGKQANIPTILVHTKQHSLADYCVEHLSDICDIIL